MSKSLALGLLLVVILPRCSLGSSVSKLDPSDPAHWVELQFVDATNSGLDYTYVDTPSLTFVSLASTDMRFWVKRRDPAVLPVMPCGLLFQNKTRVLSFDLIGSEQWESPSVQVTIGELVSTPYPARVLTTVSDAGGTRVQLAGITAPEPSCSLLLLACLPLVAAWRRWC